MKTKRPGTSSSNTGFVGGSSGPAPGKSTRTGAVTGDLVQRKPAAAVGEAADGGAADGEAADVAASSGQALTTEGLAQVEGDTMFSGPDASISSTVPAETPDKKQDANEAAFEAAGLGNAITSKTMLPVEGVNGKSFTAHGCAGHKHGKVKFTFDRAFIGDYEYAAAGKTVRGVYVGISAALSGCGKHKSVKLIQILRNITKKGGNVVVADPEYATRRQRSGWNDNTAKSKGWRVDGLDTDTTPFYVSDASYGTHGSSKKAAKLRDSPGDWKTDRNLGKEFRTCAVSYADGKGTVLACIDWGYYIDDAGNATFYPAKPTAHAGAVTELTDAAARWDAMAGNTKANLAP